MFSLVTGEMNSSMMRGMPNLPLNTLRTFEAAARHASFKKAAAELNVTPTAVSHQIRTLEHYLRMRLFEREARSVRLTSAGEALLQPLTQSFRDIARAVTAVQAAGGRRSVTLSSTVAFTARRLALAAGSFQSMHPQWTLRLHASNDVVDLAGGEADAAIRYGMERSEDMLVEPLLRDTFAPVCSPSLRVRSPRDLRQAPLIHFDWGRAFRDRNPPSWKRWAKLAGLPASSLEPELSFTDEIHAVQATIAGQGVGLLSSALITDEIARGTLVQPFGPMLKGYVYSLVYPHAAAGSPSIKALRAWIQSWLQPMLPAH
jgi:LysR family transcriptional regulator, glycine cleavage system transcriptional activator